MLLAIFVAVTAFTPQAAYDTAGRVETISHPNNLVETYTYDELHRPTSVSHEVMGTPV